MDDILFYGNDMRAVLIAGSIFVGTIVVLLFVKKVLLRKLEQFADRTATNIDNVLVDAVQNIGWLFYAVTAFFMVSHFLVLPEGVRVFTKGAFLVLLIYETMKMGEVLLQVALTQNIVASHGPRQKVPTAIIVFIKIAVWTIGLLLILSNLGININSLIAGLGIGGLAISLALQNILGDLFSSFSIALDKPFEEGDYIILGTDEGTVEKIGLKTTRIRALGGHELVVSNHELTSARINNYKKMESRRMQFGIGVVYQTPKDKLEKIPEIIEQIITDVDLTRFERAHFKSFGDSSLNFDIVYWIQGRDKKLSMDVQQEINLKIVHAFAQEGIEMAFPTQTVHVVRDNG